MCAAYCRGLWFDGVYFWTAESYEDSLGYIYQFDYNGDIVNQWLEPAYSGWSACVIIGEGNHPPNKPDTPIGETMGVENEIYSYCSSAIDPEEDQIFLLFDCSNSDILFQ